MWSLPSLVSAIARTNEYEFTRIRVERSNERRWILVDHERDRLDRSGALAHADKQVDRNQGRILGALRRDELDDRRTVLDRAFAEDLRPDGVPGRFALLRRRDAGQNEQKGKASEKSAEIAHSAPPASDSRRPQCRGEGSRVQGVGPHLSIMTQSRAGDTGECRRKGESPWQRQSRSIPPSIRV